MVHKSVSIRTRARDIKTKVPREAVYKRKLIKKLKQIPGSYFFSKEAGAIRGISDIIGSICGTFVALEVKKSLEESKKYSPRNALQDKFLADINKTGGKAYKIFPENEAEILEILCKLAIKI